MAMIMEPEFMYPEFAHLTGCFRKLWQIELIWDEIESYLSISDLKVLSLVSNGLLEKVRSVPRFASLVGQEVTGKMKIHVFQLSRAILRVNTLDRNILTLLAPTVFQKTEYLELQNLEDMPNGDMNTRLIQIVSNCPKLKSLTFGAANYFGCDFRAFLNNAEVKLVFSRLKELKIGTKNCSNLIHQNQNGRILPFELFSGLTPVLVKFTYTEPIFREKHYHPVLILKAFKETLEELHLTINFTGLEMLKEMRFPKLAKLDLSVIQTDPRGWDDLAHLGRIPVLSTNKFSEDFIPFLKNHLFSLTEFQFTSNYGFCLAPFCELLRHASYVENLQVLGFSTQVGFLQSFSSINWNFLETLPKLRDFKMTVMHNGIDEYSSNDFSPQLSLLPTTTIKSLEFRGSRMQMLNRDPSVLLRFENLTGLIIIGCGSFLNDNSLQFICKHLLQLKIFKGSFEKVTGFGISGVKNYPAKINSGISLSNLKGLTELDMCNCELNIQLGFQDLVNSIRFSKLIKLTVRDRKRDISKVLPEECLLQLLCHNPVLERIQLWDYGPTVHIRDKVEKLHPRLNLYPTDLFPVTTDLFPVTTDLFPVTTRYRLSPSPSLPHSRRQIHRCKRLN